MTIVLNQGVALDNLIQRPEDEINEGNKIISWLKTYLLHHFPDLQFKIHHGYVNIIRNGSQVTDFITSELVPNLQYLKWQENKHIEYHTLKHIIIQNTFKN